MLPKEKTRVEYCDALRAISIIAVIMIHVISSFRELYVVNNHFNYILFTTLRSLTSFAVPMFFMLTGIFLIKRKKQYSYIDFVKKILKKFILPLLIVSIIYYLYDCIASISVSFSIKELIINLYSNSIKYHLWYMYSIILIYFLIPFIRLGIKSFKQEELKKLILVLFLLTSIPATINQFLMYFGLKTLDAISYPTFFSSINYLLFGYYLYKYNIKKETKKIFYVLGIISPILMSILDGVLIRGYCWEPFFRPETIFPFFMAGALLILFKEKYSKFHISQKIKNFLYFASSNSLYIYLLHVLILEILRKVFYHFITPSNLIQNILMCLSLFILTCVITFVLIYILNKFIYRFIKRGEKNEKNFISCSLL